MLADPQQTPVSEVVLLEYLQKPGAHELSLVFPESLRGRLPHDLPRVREVAVGSHHDLGIPGGVDGIQVLSVPALHGVSRERGSSTHRRHGIEAFAPPLPMPLCQA